MSQGTELDPESEEEFAWLRAFLPTQEGPSKRRRLEPDKDIVKWINMSTTDEPKKVPLVYNTTTRLFYCGQDKWKLMKGQNDPIYVQCKSGCAELDRQCQGDRLCFCHILTDWMSRHSVSRRNPRTENVANLFGPISQLMFNRYAFFFDLNTRADERSENSLYR